MSTQLIFQRTGEEPYPLHNLHPPQGLTEVGVGREKQRAKHAGLTHRGPYQTENVCSNPPS